MNGFATIVVGPNHSSGQCPVDPQLVSEAIGWLTQEEQLALGHALAQRLAEQMASEQQAMRREVDIQNHLLRQRFSDRTGAERQAAIAQDVIHQRGTLRQDKRHGPPPSTHKSQRPPKESVRRKVLQMMKTEEGLRFLVGASVREIARKLGCTHSTLYDVPEFRDILIGRRQRARFIQTGAGWCEREAVARYG
jgi:DNA invertase Pin-like site-specific DNA recombinase